MHISEWTPTKPPEQDETPIPDDIRLQLCKQPPSLPGRCNNAPMLNARFRNAPSRNVHAEQETSMDGIVPIEAVGFSRLQPRAAPRSNAYARAAVLMAIIVAMTLLTTLALDYASIHLPTGSEELGWPPFG